MSQVKAGFDAALRLAMHGMGLAPTEEQCARLWRHFERMEEANRHFNLTRITSPADAAVKHYADSLSLLATGWADRARPLKVLDVGTGAGFPAIPLAIVCESWPITAIDGTGKKARFVAEAAELLALHNVQALHARAADLVRQGRPQFDLVLLRAVTQIAPGIEELHPLVARHGAIVFYKSANLTQAELNAGAEAGRRHGLAAMASCDVELRTATEIIHRRLVRFARG